MWWNYNEELIRALAIDYYYTSDMYLKKSEQVFEDFLNSSVLKVITETKYPSFQSMHTDICFAIMGTYGITPYKKLTGTKPTSTCAGLTSIMDYVFKKQGEHTRSVHLAIEIYKEMYHQHPVYLTDPRPRTEQTEREVQRVIERFYQAERRRKAFA